MTAHAMTWLAEAACRETDPEMFFPTAESGPARTTQTAAAKRVCAGCPVRARCLAWATDDLAYGVAGGLDATERRARTRVRTEVLA
jgi:hypothetical protein